MQPPLSSIGSADIPIYNFPGIITSGEGLCPFFLRFWSMCSGLGDSVFMSPKAPPGRAECHKSVPTHCLEKLPRGHCFGQVCPEGIIMCKWIKSHHRGWTGIIFAIPQRFRPGGTRLQWSAGATRQVWKQQNQGFFKDISFISAFSLQLWRNFEQGGNWKDLATIINVGAGTCPCKKTITKLKHLGSVWSNL